MSKFNFTTITKSGNANAKPQDVDYYGFAVTPSDSTDLPNSVSYGVYCTGAGNITANIDGAGTKSVVITMPAGGFALVPCARIFATGTTATGIYAIY